MTMRDFQRLEELSSAAATGLWAGDVALALSRDEDLLDADTALLNESADLFSGTAEEGASEARDAIDAVLADVTRELGLEEPAELSDTVASTLRHAIAGDLDPADPALERTIMVLQKISEHQLVQSDSVLTMRQDASLWMETETI